MLFAIDSRPVNSSVRRLLFVEMSNFLRTLGGLSLLLTIASWATCHFGVKHEINKIPAEQRARITDFDWVGAEWITMGMIIFLVGILCALITFVLWVIRRRRQMQQSFSNGSRA
jgi:hypothetical protein